MLRLLPGARKLPPADQDNLVDFEGEITATVGDDRRIIYRVVVVPLVEMGRVQAAMTTAAAVRHWSPRSVLLVGIAGGVAASGVEARRRPCRQSGCGLFAPEGHARWHRDPVGGPPGRHGPARGGDELPRHGLADQIHFAGRGRASRSGTLAQSPPATR